jgi:hypothetical protein
MRELLLLTLFTFISNPVLALKKKHDVDKITSDVTLKSFGKEVVEYINGSVEVYNKYLVQSPDKYVTDKEMSTYLSKKKAVLLSPIEKRKGRFYISSHKHEVYFTYHSLWKREIMINGKPFKINQGLSFSDLQEQLKQRLTKKTVTLWELFIPKVHAYTEAEQKIFESLLYLVKVDYINLDTFPKVKKEISYAERMGLGRALELGLMQEAIKAAVQECKGGRKIMLDNDKSLLEMIISDVKWGSGNEFHSFVEGVKDDVKDEINVVDQREHDEGVDKLKACGAVAYLYGAETEKRGTLYQTSRATFADIRAYGMNDRQAIREVEIKTHMKEICGAYNELQNCITEKAFILDEEKINFTGRDKSKGFKVQGNDYFQRPGNASDR